MKYEMLTLEFEQCDYACMTSIKYSQLYLGLLAFYLTYFAQIGECNMSAYMQVSLTVKFVRKQATDLCNVPLSFGKREGVCDGNCFVEVRD